MPTSAADIQDFLAQHRIALIGVSRNPKDFSRAVFREFAKRGYDMVPVNPAASELESKMCFAHVQEVSPPAEAALVMTSPGEAAKVVRDCAQAGIRRVWLVRAGGQGAVTAEAVEVCHEQQMRAIEGYCPMMFLPRAGFIHAVHRFFVKLGGRMPS